MAQRLIISDRARHEIGEAYQWYEEHLSGLGAEFLRSVDAQLSLIVESPNIHAEVRPRVRRALLSHFPYGVFYAAKGDITSILAVIHTARSPRGWPRR